jgi:DNA-directed RNA polymerase subunit RPC12/RpoP
MDTKNRGQEVPQEERTVVAEFHIESPANSQEQFLLDYYTCCLCGGELEFTHITHFVDQEVLEETRCPSCNVKTKKETHRLQ